MPPRPMSRRLEQPELLYRAAGEERISDLLLSEGDLRGAVRRLGWAADMYGAAGNHAGVVRCLTWLIKIGRDGGGRRRPRFPGGSPTALRDPVPIPLEAGSPPGKQFGEWV